MTSDRVTLVVVYCVGLVWIVLQYTVGVDITLCPTKLLFGIPCPGCGMTRACLLLLHGDILEAIKMNPNILIAFPFIVGVPLLCFMKGKSGVLKGIEALTRRRIFVFGIFVFELLVWAYNIARGV